MVQTVTKKILSGSTDGLGILITGTTTGTANIIHTATSSTSVNDMDEIWLYATNLDSSDVELSIEFGDAADPRRYTIPAFGTASTDGAINKIPGFILRNAKVVKAFASIGSDIIIDGYVHEIRG